MALARRAVVFIHGLWLHSITRATYARYRGSPALTDLIEMRGRGHSLTVDSGSSQVASTALQWLDENFRS